MGSLRHASRWPAALWLLSQAIVLAVSTLLLAAAPVRLMAAPVEHCECDGSTARICPMHPHGKSATAAMHHDAGGMGAAGGDEPTPAEAVPAGDHAGSPGDCAMRGCGQPDAVVVPAPAYPGVMPRLPSVLQTTIAVRVPLQGALPLDRPDIPDPPPPRA